MTAPDTTPASADGNVDAPTATVGLGPSEISTFVIILAGLLNSYFGKDWGLGKNAQAIGMLAAVLATLGMTIGRSIKHHGAAHANAAVYVAQLQAVASAASVAGGATPAGLAAGVSALNSAVNTDLLVPAEGDAAP